MDRARRAGLTALIVVVIVASLGGSGGAARSGGGRRLAAIDARRVGGADRRRVGIRRVRRARQPGSGAGRPGWPRGGLRDVLGLHDHAQGDLGEPDDPGSGQADPRGERAPASTQPWPTRRTPAGSPRPAAPSRSGSSAGRPSTRSAGAMRRTRFVEGTAAPAPPAGSSLERAPGRSGRQRDGHERQRSRTGSCRPRPRRRDLGRRPVPGPGPSATPIGHAESDADADAGADANRDSDADGDADPDRRRPPRHRLRRHATADGHAGADAHGHAADPPASGRPTPTPTPDSDPDAEPRPPIAEARGLAGRHGGHDPGRADDRARSTRIGSWRVRPGRDGRHRALPRCSGRPARGRPGRRSSVDGILDSRYAAADAPHRRGSRSWSARSPASRRPVESSTGAAGEPLEGMRIQVTGTIVGAPDELADGLGITIDDGIGPGPRRSSPRTPLAGREPAAGMVATRHRAARPARQLRDRLERLPDPRHARRRARHRRRRRHPRRRPLPPSPTPTASADADGPRSRPRHRRIHQRPARRLTHRRTRRPHRPRLRRRPPRSTAIAVVRGLPIGSKARTTGVVVAEAGRLGTPTAAGHRRCDSRPGRPPARRRRHVRSRDDCSRWRERWPRRMDSSRSGRRRAPSESSGPARSDPDRVADAGSPRRPKAAS